MIVSASFGLTACGSVDDDGGVAGGGGGAFGSGSGGGGAGGSTHRRVAQGAVQLFAGPVANGELAEGELPCPFPQQTLRIGVVDAVARTSIADGEDGVSVGCTVRASGAGFTIAGNIAQGTGAFGVTGYVETGKETEGEASLTLDPNLLGGNTKCTLSMQPTIEGSQLAVAPGRIWARFTCRRLEVIGVAPTRVCKAEGFVVFENCAE